MRPQRLRGSTPSYDRVLVFHNHPVRQHQFEDGYAYLLADGDCVGDRMELLLLDGDAEGAADLSIRLQQALDAVLNTLKCDFGGHIVFAGGDDLLAQVPLVWASVESSDMLRGLYQRICGCTLSIGVGQSPERAVEALRRAKLSGKNQVVVSQGS